MKYRNIGVQKDMIVPGNCSDKCPTTAPAQVGPFNVAAHHYLISIGYEHIRIWYYDRELDEGYNAGPVTDDEWYDSYGDENEYIIIHQNGTAVLKPKTENEKMWDKIIAEAQQ